jgi:tetratricopeptide (TPR) repeat protein
MNETELVEELTMTALQLAHRWRLEGRWQDTLTLLHGILPVTAELNDARRAQVWLHIARTLNDRATFGGIPGEDEHQDALENALKYSESSGDESLLGAAWDSKGMAEHARFLNSDRSTEPENELEFFEHGFKYREQVGDPRGLAESYFHLGLVHQVVRRDSKTGEPFFERAYELAKKAKDRVMQSYAVRHIGFARDAAGDYKGALAGYQESLALREEAGFKPGVAMALFTLGEFEAEQGHPDRARGYFLQARELLTGLGAAARVEMVERRLDSLNGG